MKRNKMGNNEEIREIEEIQEKLESWEKELLVIEG